MADYIKREDAIRYIKENQCASCSDIGLCGNCAVLIALKLLEKVSAADVRENVRGEWHERKDIYPHKPDGEMTSWGYKCSRCNQISQLKYNFCFNCGADMRGGEKDD